MKEKILCMILTKEEIKQQIRPKKCWCGYTELHKQPVNGYPHEGGYDIEGEDERLWLYITCPKCDYDWALWKLGVVHPENTRQTVRSVRLV